MAAERARSTRMCHSLSDNGVWRGAAWPVTRLLYTALLLVAPGFARGYQLEGSIVPEAQASISIFGATRPFAASTLSESDGRFRIKNLAAGSYTVSVFVSGSC